MHMHLQPHCNWRSNSSLDIRMNLTRRSPENGGLPFWDLWLTWDKTSPHARVYYTVSAHVSDLGIVLIVKLLYPVCGSDIATVSPLDMEERLAASEKTDRQGEHCQSRQS